MAYSLAEQVILITGASAGIGAALAAILAQRYPGVRLVLAARNVSKLEAVADRCRQAGAEVRVVPTDMAQISQVTTLAEMTLQEFGRIDAIVSNAGYGQMGPLELVPAEAAQRQFQVNVLGPLALVRALIPTLRNQGGGKIIMVSSIAGRIAFPFGGLYSASKFALEGLSDALRRELKPFNIQISVVEPGAVRNEFVDVAKQQVAALEVENNPYQAAFNKFDSLEQQVDRTAWTSEQVAEVIIRALKASAPKPRYIAATGGNILVALMTKLLPTSIVDAFWQRFYGIDQVAKDWQQQLVSRS